MFTNFYDLFNKLYLLLILLLFILLPGRLFAGGDSFSLGARSAAMGRTSVAMGGFWGLTNNQSAISLAQQYQVGIHYESRLGLNELSTKAIGVISPLPRNIGVMGISFIHFGYSSYNEMKLGLAYARSFAPFFRLGIQLDYLRINIGDNYGSKDIFTFEVGMQSDIGERITIGVYTFNPIGIKISEDHGEKLASVFRLGLLYKIENYLLISLEAEKRTSINPVVVRLGMEYDLKSKFYFRTGIASRYEVFTLGFGMKLKFIKIDLAAGMHQILGFSPQMSMTVNF